MLVEETADGGNLIGIFDSPVDADEWVCKKWALAYPGHWGKGNYAYQYDQLCWETDDRESRLFLIRMPRNGVREEAEGKVAEAILNREEDTAREEAAERAEYERLHAKHGEAAKGLATSKGDKP